MLRLPIKITCDKEGCNNETTGVAQLLDDSNDLRIECSDQWAIACVGDKKVSFCPEHAQEVDNCKKEGRRQAAMLLHKILVTYLPQLAQTDPVKDSVEGRLLVNLAIAVESFEKEIYPLQTINK